MSASDDDSGAPDSSPSCAWRWPVWCIVLTAIAGVLLLSGLVLTGLNARTYRRMRDHGLTVPPPARGARRGSRGAAPAKAAPRSPLKSAAAGAAKTK